MVEGKADLSDTVCDYVTFFFKLFYSNINAVWNANNRLINFRYFPHMDADLVGAGRLFHVYLVVFDNNNTDSDDAIYLDRFIFGKGVRTEGLVFHLDYDFFSRNWRHSFIEDEESANKGGTNNYENNIAPLYTPLNISHFYLSFLIVINLKYVPKGQSDWMS